RLSLISYRLSLISYLLSLISYRSSLISYRSSLFSLLFSPPLRQFPIPERIVHRIQVHVDRPAAFLQRADARLDFVRDAVRLPQGDVLVENEVELHEVDFARAAGLELVHAVHE